MVTRVLVGETMTGIVLADNIPVSAASWSQVLNETGEVTATIPLGDPSVAALNLVPYLDHWRHFLAVVEDDVVLEAGPIVAHDYDDASRRLQVKAMGMRHIFTKRLAARTGIDNPQRTTMEFSGLSLGTIGKRLVERALNNPTGNLPIILPKDVTGNAERTYPGHELATIGQRLDELTEVRNGPEFAFTPRLSADRLYVEWVMRSGSPLLRQAGADWVWDTSAPQGGVGGISVKRDGANRVNNLYVTGEGMDEALKTARGTDVADRLAGYPLLEDAFSHSQIKRQAMLQNHADAYVEQGSAPWTTWELEVSADATPKLVQPDRGTYRPGDWVRVHVGQGHPYIPAGAYRSRIASLSGDISSRMVRITLRPTLEER